MNGAIGRICLLLASAGFSNNEVRSFCRWVEERGAASTFRTIEELRRIASRAEHDPSVPLLSREGDQSNPSKQRAEIADKVEALLLSDAGLTKFEAIEFVARELGEYSPSSSPLPHPGKMSFRAWIERLQGSIPPSVLLHVANKIRNELVHLPKSDWPLRKRDK